MLTGLCYTGGILHRAADRRRDPAWLDERRADPATCVIAVWRDRNLVVTGARPAPLVWRGPAAAAGLAAAEPAVLLGVDRSAAWLAVDISAWSEAELRDRMAGGAAATELRRIGSLLAAADAALLAYARGILHWHRRHQFCGRCGAETRSLDAGHRRLCTAADCAVEQFPRTDPAVIMLVTRPNGSGGACLLARQARWPRGMYSTLAGFVEPGESLEEAVAREVLEEVGVAVADVRYRGSQPWPFPSSLMLGFRAVTDGEAKIAFDTEELEDARWFTRAEVRDFAARGLKMPGADSIARHLIAEWLAEGP